MILKMENISVILKYIASLLTDTMIGVKCFFFLKDIKKGGVRSATQKGNAEQMNVMLKHFLYPEYAYVFLR